MMRAFSVAVLLLAGLVSDAASASAAPTWQRSVPTAFAEARASGRPLLVDLYADWCGWCKVMEAKVFPDPLFREAARSYVLLRVDVEDSGEGSELASRYDSTSLPTLLVLEPSGALVGLVEGYAPAPDLVAQLKNVHAIYDKVLATYSETLAENDAEQLRRVASDFYRRRDGERAANLFARLIAVAPSQGDDAARLRFFHADSLRRAQRFGEARLAAERAAALATPSSELELAERLALLPFWIARDDARCSEATGELTTFEREHPKSVFLAGARRALAELRTAGAECS